MDSWSPMLAELWRTRGRDLIAYGSMLTGSRADAEDLVQDALVATFGRNRSFTHVVAAESYVRKAMASRYIDRMRSAGSQRRAFAKIGVTEADGAATPDLLAEHSTDVARALQALSPRERACVVLRYVSGLTIAETAATLGIAEGTVKRYVSDGLATLNDLLGTTDDLTDTVAVSVHALEER